MRITNPVKLSLATAVLLVVMSAGIGANWPGLWGPARNGMAPGSLRSARGEATTLWRRPVQGGYSEIAVAHGRAVTLELRDGNDYLVSLDAATGREQWALRIGQTYRGHGGSDDGPISTPALDANDVFALGPYGHLVAADAATGRERWRHDLVKEFGAAPPTWGFAASPLIEGGIVVLPTGGENSRGLLAFDRSTGKLVWNASIARAPAYSSAVAGTLHGIRQIVAVAADRVYGVDPADGRVLWNAPGPGGNIEVSNSALVLPGDRLLLSTWEQAVMVQVSKADGGFSARELWRSNRLRNANGPILYRDGHLYGFAGPILVCINAETQEITWRERTGAGTLMAVGSELVVLGDGSGEMVIADINPQKFVLRHRLKVLSDGIRAVTGASFADGRFYLRNLREVIAVRVE